MKKPGFNVFGYFDSVHGLAESARLVLKSLEKSSIPYETISVNPHNLNFTALPKLPYSINLFCIDLENLIILVNAMGWKKIASHYNIGNIFWETNIFPKFHVQVCRYFNEIWVTSRYLQEHISIAQPIPVHRINQPIELLIKPNTIDKTLFGIEDKFTYLFYFNFRSILNRKNPLALISAFKKAFPDSKDVQLVIKSQYGASDYPEELEKLLKGIKADPRIKWIDETMSLQKRYDLMNACDCYVSLHRSEGLGLTMAEAMLLEKPVIATGYSGNLDFMNDDNSYLCPYVLRPIGTGNSPYPPKGVWADVDIDRAAYHMQEVFANRENAKAKARKGKDSILTHHSFEYVGEQIQCRLNQIQLPQHPNPMPAKYIKYRLYHKYKYCFPRQCCVKVKNLICHALGDK